MDIRTCQPIPVWQAVWWFFGADITIGVLCFVVANMGFGCAEPVRPDGSWHRHIVCADSS
jgi:hypothetical protein